MPKRRVLIEVDLDDLFSAGNKKIHGKIRQETAKTERTTKKAAAGMRRSYGDVTSTLRKMKGTLAGLGVGLGFAVATRQVFNFSADLETALAEVATISDDVRDNIQGFNKDIIKMSTRLPQSAVALSRGLYQVISAGVQDTADAMSVLEVSTKAAVGGLSSAEVAVDAITTVLNAYSLSAEKAKSISDIMFTTVKEGKIRFEELAVTVGDIAPTAALLGISFEEMAASMATLTKTGTSFRDAATQIRNIMLRILDPIDEARDAAKQYGIELSKAGIEKAGGFVEFLGLVNDKVGDNVEALQKIFPEMRAFRGAAVLAGVQAKGLDRILGKMTESTGAADKAFEIIADTTKVKMQFALDSINASLSTLGAKTLPLVAGALSEVANSIESISEAFRDFQTTRAVELIGAIFGAPTEAQLGGMRDFIQLQNDAIEARKKIAGLQFVFPEPPKLRLFAEDDVLGELIKKGFENAKNDSTAISTDVADMVSKSKQFSENMIVVLGHGEIEKRQRLEIRTTTAKTADDIKLMHDEMQRMASTSMPAITSSFLGLQLVAQNVGFDMQNAFRFGNMFADALFRAAKGGENLADSIKRMATQFRDEMLRRFLGGLVGAGIGALFGQPLAGFKIGAGFQHGGSFTVPGPDTGRDDRLVAFRARGQERVTVTPQNTITNNTPVTVNINASRIDRRFVETELVTVLNKVLTRNNAQLA